RSFAANTPYICYPRWGSLPLAPATSRSANAVSGKNFKANNRHIDEAPVTLSCYATFARTCYECGLRVCTATKYQFSKQATAVKAPEIKGIQFKFKQSNINFN
ncbi:MAG TPA: hypothetical protein DCZ76_06140, partial [Treponema sp.]|nr:hypothetical protein [Treponema sp.]